MKLAVLFWFYKEPEICHNRLEILRQHNPTVPIYGLYGGDLAAIVLFWHPYTIHGVYNNRDPRFSRKSLTAHYYPGYLQRLYASTAPIARTTVNPAVQILGSELEAYRFNAMHYVRAIANYVRRRGPAYDMRRNSYT